MADAFIAEITIEEADALTKGVRQVWESIGHGQENESNVLALGESWAAIHFLLTGEVPTPKYQALQLGISWNESSLENVLMGGEPTGYETSFGLARFLYPAETRDLAKHLSVVSVEKFSAWYDPQVLLENRIPPNIWAWESEMPPWLSENFVELKTFYQVAASNAKGLLFYFV